MKKSICAAIALLCCLIGKAQITSLNPKEISLLKMTLDIDERPPYAYKTAFKPINETAHAALNDQPNPIELIQSQGILEGDPRKSATQKALHDIPKVYALAMLYKTSGQERFRDKAVEFLLAWAKTNHSEGDPINETKLEDMVFAYDLIRSGLPTDEQQRIDNWFAADAEALVNSKSARPGKGTAINNWNSHRIKMITLIAYTIHTDKYDDYIKTELEKQLEVNLNADGTTLDFMERDAFHYHTYDLEPLLSTIIAIKRKTGKDYFTWQTSKGASIKKCVDFMVPYMTGEKQHGEFTNSKVKFDQQRAQNHEKGYEAGTPFNPKSGIYTLSLAAYFDPSYIQTIRKVTGNPDYTDWQLILNEVRKKAKS